MACQNGGILLGGSMTSGYKRSSVLYHQYNTPNTCMAKTIVIPISIAILRSPCRDHIKVKLSNSKPHL